ncbi:hypothetical protein K7I13_13450 [Brucepastera parasyntrophica]|uniref:hypothetical protein n=1 Tax=Brucepastera parasyntrophica TaxID=2880008 RepID=UPI0021092AA9|nr:hypothetical protein [Brucepastera parasyntrophica]ULQ59464.1 hypothetical protein K7I13_13450 [Brucepastera parasyntrophica]
MTIAAGLCAAVIQVLNWNRIGAGITVLLTLAVYGFLAFGLSPERQPKPDTK